MHRMHHICNTALVAILAVYLTTGQVTTNSSVFSCGCCPAKHCDDKSVPCSTNSNCQCLFMTMTASGMCANAVVNCSNLTLCEKDNKTCSTPNTICVNNTQCKVPVCYPIEHASMQQCPPLTPSRTNIDTVITAARTSSISSATTTTLSMQSFTTTTTSTSSIKNTTSSMTINNRCETYLYNTSMPRCMPNQTHITFDDYTTTCTEVLITEPYSRLLWSNAGICHVSNYRYGAYRKVVTSGQYVLFNWSALPMNISSINGMRFTLHSFIAAAAWEENLSVTMKGYRNGSEIYSRSYILSTQNVTRILLNWSDIDVFYLLRTTTQLAMDSYCITF